MVAKILAPCPPVPNLKKCRDSLEKIEKWLYLCLAKGNTQQASASRTMSPLSRGSERFLYPSESLAFFFLCKVSKQPQLVPGNSASVFVLQFGKINWNFTVTIKTKNLLFGLVSLKLLTCDLLYEMQNATTGCWKRRMPCVEYNLYRLRVISFVKDKFSCKCLLVVIAKE